MSSGVALLIALVLQSANGGAPDAAGSDVDTKTKARLELRGAAECLSRADLAARVAARSARIEFVDDAAIYAQVVLTSSRPGNVVAELVLATSGAEQPPRRFVARSCGEAADAIALIIAVTLDPMLTRSAPYALAPPAAPPPAGPPPAAVEAAAPPPQSRAARRTFGADVAAQTIFGPAPSVMPGIAASGMAALECDGAWAPALFVGFTHAWRNDLSEPGGTASFTLDAATLDACPVRFGSPRFVARPCASGLVGRLAAAGADTQNPASAARPFGAAGAAVLASAGTTVVVSARVGVGVTLLRDSYDFSGPTFHRASALTVAASLGVGLRGP